MIKLKKIKELRPVYRLIICGVITIIALICIRLLVCDWKNKVDDFDYSKVYSVNGVITEIGWDYSPIHDETVHSVAYMNVDLENGESIRIELGGDTGGYSEGESVVIYTDGSQYSITREGVADASEHTFLNMLGCLMLDVLICAVWGWLFGRKGFLIAMAGIIFVLLW